MEKELYENLKAAVKGMLSSGILVNRSLYITPANESGMIIMQLLGERGYRIRGVIDEEKRMQGKRLCGIEIKKAEDYLIPYRENIQIIVTDWSDSRTQTKLDFLQYYTGVQKIDFWSYAKRRGELQRAGIIKKLHESPMALQTRLVVKGGRVVRSICPKGKNLLLFPHRSIGDIYVLGIYQNQIWKDDNYVFAVIGNACRSVADWMGIRNVISVSETEMKAMVQYYLLAGDRNIRVLHFDYDRNGCVPIMADMKRMSFVECYQRFVFDESLKENDLVRAKRIGEFSKANEGKRVVLSPYAKSLPSLDFPFWEMLAGELQQKGYDVYTNCGGDSEHPIYGTKQLKCGLLDFVEFIQSADLFIGERSGLCDLISDSNCKKVILYPRIQRLRSSMMRFYTLQVIPYSHDFMEIECSQIVGEREMGKICAKILLYVGGIYA